MEEKKLRRRKWPSWFLGTCSGLGDYYDFDPLPLRLLVLMLWMITPISTLLVYFIVSFFFMHPPDLEKNDVNRNG